MSRSNEEATEDPAAGGGLLAQIARFGVVGIIAFAIDYALLMLLSQVLGMNPVPAAAISFVVSLVFNYLASMRLVFSHREELSKRREFAIFLALSAVGLGINEACVWLAPPYWGPARRW